MKIRIATALSLMLALALPAATHAALPKAKSTLIVPAKSIGGVALGSNAKAVVKAWGKTKECEYECTYEGSKGSGETASLASALLETKATNSPPKVWLVSISVAEKEVGTKLTPNFNTPLTAFKTSKGIGLGSKASELQHAYHGVKKTPVVGGGGLALYELAGPGESRTTFSAGASGRITNITIEAHPGG